MRQSLRRFVSSSTPRCDLHHPLLNPQCPHAAMMMAPDDPRDLCMILLIHTLLAVLILTDLCVSVPASVQSKVVMMAVNLLILCIQLLL